MARLPNGNSKRIGKISGIIRIIVGIPMAAIAMAIYTTGYAIHRIKEKMLTLCKKAIKQGMFKKEDI